MFKEFRLLFPFFSPFSFMTSISFSFYFIVFYCFLFFCSFQFYHGLILDFLSHLRLNPTLQRVPSINRLKTNRIDGTVCIKYWNQMSVLLFRTHSRDGSPAGSSYRHQEKAPVSTPAPTNGEIFDEMPDQMPVTPVLILLVLYITFGNNPCLKKCILNFSFFYTNWFLALQWFSAIGKVWHLPKAFTSHL